MLEPSASQLDAIARRLAQLLEIDEAGWFEAANELDRSALEDGFDLLAEYGSAKAWANSVVARLRSYIDLKPFSEGISSLNEFEAAHDLFWTIFPDWKRTGL